ncbi:pyridoxamine 5'-phosphate oxidase family protein [Clostridium sp. JNZ J1-5]
MNKQMSYSELKDHILEFLREHKSAALATSMDEIPRCSPVQYFLGKDMDIYILSAGGDKFKNIEENSNVCLLVNTEYINYRKIKGVQIFGKATICKQDIKVLEESEKYCPDRYLVEEETEFLRAIKIVPEEIVYLNSLKNGDRTKQILNIQNNEVNTIYEMAITTLSL